MPPPDNFDIGWTQFYLTCTKCGAHNNPVSVRETRPTKPCHTCGQPIDLKSPEAQQARDAALKSSMERAVKDAGG